MKMDVLVMENLLFGRTVKRLYDLKGSLRSRYNPDANANNKVLLDQNLIEAIPTSPIFVGNKAKRLLERAVWNDTSLLAVSKIPLVLFKNCEVVPSYVFSGIIMFKYFFLVFANLLPYVCYFIQEHIFVLIAICKVKMF